MGIDIYLSWKGQTKKQKEAQYTGFSIEAGNVGYLREAYHGTTYATQVLVPEAFNDDTCKADIKAKVLRARLPETISAVIKRHKETYADEVTEQSPCVKAYIDFVDLAEKMEKKTGKPCTIKASY